MTALLLFVVIETVGYLFWNVDNEICPKCHGTGKIWVSGYPGVFPGYNATCPTCGGTGRYWICSIPASIAVYSFSFASCFFGFFLLSYVSTSFYASVNPWVSSVEEMEWPFNPMYFTWLFETDRRRWALYTTLLDLLFTILIGTLIAHFLILYQRTTFNKSLIGFSVGAVFVLYVALSWYRGFWKPRTRESRVTQRLAENTRPAEKPKRLTW